MGTLIAANSEQPERQVRKFASGLPGIIPRGVTEMATKLSLRTAVLAASLVAMPVVANATTFDFTTFPTTPPLSGYLNTTHLEQTLGGINVAVDSYYNVAPSSGGTIDIGSASPTESLYLRNSGEHGLGICNPTEYANNQCGNGNYNELSNEYLIEEMLLTKSTGSWQNLIVDSMDSGGTNNAESGTIYWSDGLSFSTVNSATFKYPNPNGSGDILSNLIYATGANHFNGYAAHILLTPNMANVVSGTTSGNNDYLVWKTNVVPEPGTLALLGLGLLAVGVAARRSRA